MNKINKKTLLLSILLWSILFAPLVTMANPFLGESSASSSSNEHCTIIRAIKDALLAVGATIVVIGWVIAGILWLVSGGSPEKIGIAKKATWAALIGTALIVLAQVAVTLIKGLLGQNSTIAGC